MIKKSRKNNSFPAIANKFKDFDSNVFPFREVGFKNVHPRSHDYPFFSPAHTLAWTEHIKTPHRISFHARLWWRISDFSQRVTSNKSRGGERLGIKIMLAFPNMLNIWLMRCCSLLSWICLRLWKCHPWVCASQWSVCFITAFNKTAAALSMLFRWWNIMRKAIPIRANQFYRWTKHLTREGAKMRNTYFSMYAAPKWKINQNISCKIWH